MPAKSIKQRRAMAIAKNNPDKLYARNKSLKKMTKKQLTDFATTSERKLKINNNKEKRK